MSWRDWRFWDYVLVSRAEEDPDFRDELASLASKGLMAIGAVCLGAPLIALLAGGLGVSEMVEDSAILAVCSIITLGVVATILSRQRSAQPLANLIGMGVGYLVGVIQLWASLTGPEVEMGSGHHIPGNVSMVMLVGIAALPMRPLQTTFLGSALLVSYWLLIPLADQTIDMNNHRAHSVLVVMVILVGTGLTAVIYQRRLAAFRARWQAVDALEQLQEAQSRLLISETAASQGRLAAALSHELNTPLGALNSALDTLSTVFERQRQGRAPDPEIASQAFQAAGAASGRLTETITRMKHLTNLGRAGVQQVDLNQLWEDTVTLIRAEFGEDLNLTLELSPLPDFKGNPQQLSTVFTNLLRNAAAAIDSAGSIRVTSGVGGGELILEVRDTGKGIAPDRIPQLFNPSFHVARNRVGTTNWGLFVAQSIVVNHGGRIEIESRATIKRCVNSRGGEYPSGLT